MIVRAKGEITLTKIKDIKANYRYYLLQPSTLSTPQKPINHPPAAEWKQSEPNYLEGSTNTLYTVDEVVYSDDTFVYSAVSISSSYEAAKSAWNKANNAQNSADKAASDTQQLRVDMSKEIEETEGHLLRTFSEKHFTKEETEKLISSQSSKIEQNAQGIEIRFKQLENQLAGVQDDANEKEQYIRMVNGEIVIGKTDSPVTSVYTNNSLEFRYNGDVVARFTNKDLKVRNIESNNQVGFFGQWATRKGMKTTKGYNLNDIWIGG